MPPLPFIAVTSDMDGTLLSPKHSISAYTRHVLNRLRDERGIPFILATGRPHADVLETMRKTNLEGYLVTSNGARVHDPQRKMILAKDLDADVARALVHMTPNTDDITTCFYQGDFWYTDKDNEVIREFYRANEDAFFPRLFDRTSFADYEGVYKVYYTSYNYALLGELESDIKKQYAGSVSVAYSLPNCLEVMAAGVNKGATLAQVLKQFIFPKDPRTAEELMKACISFGDGENDVQMLMMAGLGCLMANAQPHLLSGVPFGTDPHLIMVGSNADDGVAKKLVEVFGL